MPPDPLALAILFLSTLSLRRATQITVMQATDAMPFLSTLSLRRATIPCGYFVTPIVFLSTLSLRRATLLIVAIRGIVLNFYPRSPCGERRLIPDARELSSIISIHALLAESDLFHQVIQRRGVISIHALLAESDIVIPDAGISEMISIHALLAESDALHKALLALADISIHALLAESDTCGCILSTPMLNFYPRSPCGERQSAPPKERISAAISIHALLAESDLATVRT